MESLFIVVLLAFICVANAFLQAAHAPAPKPATPTLTLTPPICAGSSCPPVVFIPGLTEAILVYTLDNYTSLFPFCPNGTDTKENILWPIPSSVVTIEHYLCWFELMETFYDAETEKYSSQVGIKLSTQNFGLFSSIAFGNTVKSGWIQNGWVEGKTIFCAPYDWRFPSAKNGQVTQISI